ncbi:hypothetical protein BD560DRAFT_426009 [Blakeslea trispora]|nr:hypothetical protein BD560DRAFT_426009 [Blakeslea trispora]
MLEFLKEFLIQVIKCYEDLYDYDSNEDAFNQAFVWPYLDLIDKRLNKSNCKGYFVQGQPCLESMSRQIKAAGVVVDETSNYKTYGLIKLFGLKNLELLLLETSGHFPNTDKVKIKFDNHKGMYGNLAMLKCISDDFPFASVETFSCVKVFFVQAATNMLFLQDIVCLLRNSVENICNLKKEHQANSSDYISNPEKYTKLSDVVSPTITKLTKEEDISGLGNLVPMFLPQRN